MGLHGAGGDEHALADLAVGAAGSNVAGDLKLGGGQAVPAEGWAFSLSPSPADVGDRFVGWQCGARGERGLVTVAPQRSPGGQFDGNPELRLRGKADDAEPLASGRDRKSTRLNS